MASPSRHTQHFEESHAEHQPQSAATHASGSRVPRPRPTTSSVWEFFTTETREGTRYAVCKICQKAYKHSQGTGTGTLTKHAKTHSDQPGTGSSQTQLGFTGEGGSMGIFTYDQSRNEYEMARFVMADEQPLSFGESTEFTRYVRTALQPAYCPVARNTLKRRCFALHEESKAFLIATLSSLISVICLTSDIWTDRMELPWFCLTAHWIDTDWVLQKWIIAFKRFPYPHSSTNISSAIKDVLSEYTNFEKKFCITFDNASNNSGAIGHLKIICKPMLDGAFFHIRCACHILNLAVQDAYRVCTGEIALLRKAIKSVRSTARKREDYKIRCQERGVRHSFANDVTTRWNSTYDMLRKVRPSYEVINEIWNATQPPQYQLTDELWELGDLFISFLGTFKDATLRLSATYEPTAHLILSELYNISTCFTMFVDKNPVLDGIIVAMKDKISKYFRTLPLVFCICTVMDPRLKLDGVHFILQEFHQQMNHENVNVDGYLEEVKKTLHMVFDDYAERSSTISRPTQQTTSSSRSSNPLFARLQERKKSKTSSSTSSINELNLYLETEHDINTEVEFDILAWWKFHETRYPILSTIARDFLTVQVSTVASENAFSTGGRILSEKRCSLAEDTVEVMICMQDWEAAKHRVQNKIALDSDVLPDEITSSDEMITES